MSDELTEMTVQEEAETEEGPDDVATTESEAHDVVRPEVDGDDVDSGTPNRREVDVTGPLRFVAKACIDLLVENNVPPVLFLAGDRLVRIADDGQGGVVIAPLDQDWLRARLARKAFFINPTAKGVQNVPPPTVVLRDLLCLGWNAGGGEEPNPFPRLDAVATRPYLRPDGSVFDHPGYDDMTCTFFAAPAVLGTVNVPGEPGDEDRNRAKALLDELMGDFPFVDAASKANAMALLFTPHVKLAIGGLIPIGLISARQRGTGKTSLASAIWEITTGTQTPIMVMPEGDEFRKQITGLLRTGTELVILDNIEGHLGSARLSAALTSAIWRDREIGFSRMLTLRNSAIWLATGNNLRVRGDLQRRAYLIEMDAGMVRPWERDDFHHPDFLAWILQNRAAIIEAILTLARAWYVDGCPPPSAELGGFREWSRVVGGIVEHAGWSGFLGNQATLYDEIDEEQVQWERFLAELAALYGTSEFTVGDLVPRFRGSEQLQDALPDDLEEALGRRDSSFRRRLGKAFARNRDRRFRTDGLRIVRAGTRHQAALWRIEIDTDAPAEGN